MEEAKEIEELNYKHVFMKFWISSLGQIANRHRPTDGHTDKLLYGNSYDVLKNVHNFPGLKKINWKFFTFAYFLITRYLEFQYVRSSPKDAVLVYLPQYLKVFFGNQTQNIRTTHY